MTRSIDALRAQGARGGGGGALHGGSTDGPDGAAKGRCGVVG